MDSTSSTASAGPGGSRERKACIQCYQKKVRCDYSTELASCTRCRDRNLECLLPSGDQKPLRTSMRSGFEGLSSRIEQLENIVYFNPTESAALSNLESTAASIEARRLSLSDSDMRISSTTAQTSIEPSVVRSYRGATSPWTTLTDHMESSTHPQHLGSFRDNVSKLAEDDRSTILPGKGITYDLLRDFPTLSRGDVFKFVRTYAREAPYPILHYDVLMHVTQQLLDQKRLTRWGQLACILMYMAFGSSRMAHVEASMSPQEQSGAFGNAAWRLLPQLLLDHDLWALKALTLMVHYLQASSTPETCWALLGSASRMAIALGFHQKTRKVQQYNPIEMEEGKRAWWLCFVMEKTFCSTFGYPSSTGTSRRNFNADYPAPFVPIPNDPIRSDEDSFIYGEHETDAVAFFRDMIELTSTRDDILHSASTGGGATDPQSISELLRSTLRDEQQGLFIPSIPEETLRSSISDLAHYNAIQVIAMQLSPAASLPPEGVLSARATLQIILETQTAGTTMCLWMWLYYAFTAVVILFLHSLAEPLHPDTMLDLALLSDVQSLCAAMADHSDGARRIMEISGQMEKLSLEVGKRAARRKRSATAADGNDAASPATRRSGKSRRTAERLQEGEVSTAVRTQTEGEAGPSEGRPVTEPEAITLLETAPQSFEWDQWDQWLEGGGGVGEGGFEWEENVR